MPISVHDVNVILQDYIRSTLKMFVTYLVNKDLWVTGMSSTALSPSRAQRTYILERSLSTTCLTKGNDIYFHTLGPHLYAIVIFFRKSRRDSSGLSPLVKVQVAKVLFRKFGNHRSTLQTRMIESVTVMKTLYTVGNNIISNRVLVPYMLTTSDHQENVRSLEILENEILGSVYNKFGV